MRTVMFLGLLAAVAARAADDQAAAQSPTGVSKAFGAALEKAEKYADIEPWVAHEAREQHRGGEESVLAVMKRMHGATESCEDETIAGDAATVVRKVTIDGEHGYAKETLTKEGGAWKEADCGLLEANP